MLLSLFVTFFKIGLVSFGGGYAMMPVIQREVVEQNWLSAEAFNQVITLAGTGPGPIATNSATLVGLQIAGVPGAIAATFGMVLPSLLLIILLAAFLYKWHTNKWFKSSFYGLKPVVTGFIIFAAIHFGLAGWGTADLQISWDRIATVLITVGAFFGIIKFKLHPFLVIVSSGLMGIVFFQ
ncbi:chromate transporter [Paenibacillus marchantiophytorum]|uniref:Chromate transporter n=1 Tax=Paenibacillus marchantiophytorum TaxID=1619310 RepID=A0ABQ1FJC6_9BACL|nr:MULTISPECIES: chromate transporter [Paenibacillus]UKS30820.1 chromate transporter [Paenibacillus sp. HWE-109]GGA17652.1 chromate transporter [Paenibacillus marchantiophytorum]